MLRRGKRAAPTKVNLLPSEPLGKEVRPCWTAKDVTIKYCKPIQDKPFLRLYAGCGKGGGQSRGALRDILWQPWWGNRTWRWASPSIPTCLQAYKMQCTSQKAYAAISWGRGGDILHRPRARPCRPEDSFACLENGCAKDGLLFPCRIWTRYSFPISKSNFNSNTSWTAHFQPFEPDRTGDSR